MTFQPTSQVTNSNSKVNSTTVTSKQQAAGNKGNPQIQEEWGDEDGEFELEDDDNTQIEQSLDEKYESSEPTGHNVDDGLSINCQTVNNKSSSKQTSSSSSPLSQNTDTQENDDSPKTKYGRKVQKPVLFTSESKKSQPKRSLSNKSIGKRPRRMANISYNVTPQNSRQDVSPFVSSPETSQNAEVIVKIEQDSDQIVADDTVCILCRDGNSPKHNRIVLCDKCDTPYHQRCHKPAIENRVVEIPDAEWICLKCDDLRGHKRRKVEIIGAASVNAAASSSSRSVSSEVSGDGLTEDQKIAYLSSLPQRVLIDLILIAEKLHPDLPLYPADVKDKIANNAYASDRGNDSRVLATATSLSNQSFIPQMSITSQPLQNYSLSSSSSSSSNLSRAHLPAVGIDLPSYEEMIVRALESIADPAGSAPRNIFDWMNSTYPLHKNFRASASQALQKAVKKGRIFRIGTVYKINPNYRPAKRTRRFFKRPNSVEPSAYDNDDGDDDYGDYDDNDDYDYDDDDNDDGDIPETDSHNGHDEIAVKLDDNDNFTSVHSLDIEEHPSLTSSAASSPFPNAISNGHTTVTSPEANSPLDDMSNKAVSVLIGESSMSTTSTSSIMSNQSILSPPKINNSTVLPSTLLHPPMQQTLPSLSTVTFFGSGCDENKQNSIFYPLSHLSYTGSYNNGVPFKYKTSLSQEYETGNSSSSAGAVLFNRQ